MELEKEIAKQYKNRKIEKLELLKIASPPRSLTESEKLAWSAGLNWGIDRVIKELLAMESSTNKEL